MLCVLLHLQPPPSQAEVGELPAPATDRMGIPTYRRCWARTGCWGQRRGFGFVESTMLPNTHELKAADQHLFCTGGARAGAVQEVRELPDHPLNPLQRFHTFQCFPGA